MNTKLVQRAIHIINSNTILFTGKFSPFYLQENFFLVVIFPLNFALYFVFFHCSPLYLHRLTKCKESGSHKQWMAKYMYQLKGAPV